MKSDFAWLHARSACVKESHQKHTAHVGQKQKSQKAQPINLTRCLRLVPVPLLLGIVENEGGQ
jgi:hypothetical protein